MTIAIMIIMATVMASLLTVRMIGNDEHYGEIGFGNLTESAANTFSAGRLPAIAEPDLVIKTGTGSRRVLEIDIDDVLVWDNRKWNIRGNYSIDVAGAEGIEQAFRAGITRDNTSDGTDAPTANSIAEGTTPGGRGATVTGSAADPNTVIMNGTDVPRYIQHFDFGRFANEENATGEINISGMSNTPMNDVSYKPYEVNGVTCHYLMTAAHYQAWLVGTGLAAAGNLDVGAQVRRMSVDVDELFFDREVLLSILDALVLTN